MQGDGLDQPTHADSVRQRLQEYRSRIQEEGEMDENEAREVDEVIQGQETEDDRAWVVRLLALNYQSVNSSPPFHHYQPMRALNSVPRSETMLCSAAFPGCEQPSA
jgi:hypothetical protein